MLRNLVLAGGVVLAAVGLVTTLLAGPAGMSPLIFGGLVVIGCVFERAHYRRLAAAAPGAPFERTPERFRDPETGAVVRVNADPQTGERAYVRE